MRRLALTAAVLLLPSLACAQGPSPVELEIRSLEDAVNAAYQANDLPKYFAYYADDFRGLFPECISRKRDYVKSWTAFIKSGGRIEKFTYSSMVVQVSPSKDAAVASYHAVARTKN